jgi:hypothetical protein
MIGKYPDLRRADACAKALEIRHQIASGDDPRQDRPGEEDNHEGETLSQSRCGSSEIGN